MLRPGRGQDRALHTAGPCATLTTHLLEHEDTVPQAPLPGAIRAGFFPAWARRAPAAPLTGRPSRVGPAPPGQRRQAPAAPPAGGPAAPPRPRSPHPPHRHPRRGERSKPACAASAARSLRARLPHALSLLREPRLVRAGTPPIVLIKGVRTGHPCPSLHSDTRRGGVPRPRSDWPLQSEGKSGPGTRARRLEPGGATHAPLGAARPPTSSPPPAGAQGARGRRSWRVRTRLDQRAPPTTHRAGSVRICVPRLRRRARIPPACAHTRRTCRPGTACRPTLRQAAGVDIYTYAYTGDREPPPRRVSPSPGCACQVYTPATASARQAGVGPSLGYACLLRRCVLAHRRPRAPATPGQPVARLCMPTAYMRVCTPATARARRG